MSSKSEADRSFETALLALVAGGILTWFLIRTVPQLLSGVLIGALLGAVVAFFADGSTEERSRQRAAAKRLIVSGLVTAASYYALDGSIGADAEMRRFKRAWESVGPSLEVLFNHPWAVLPLGCAAGLVGAGLATWVAGR